MVNSRSSSKPLRALRYNVQLHSNQSHEYHLRNCIDALNVIPRPWKTYDTPEKIAQSSGFNFYFSYFLRVLLSISLVISN
jgi:hypothetical protein